MILSTTAHTAGVGVGIWDGVVTGITTGDHLGVIHGDMDGMDIIMLHVGVIIRHPIIDHIITDQTIRLREIRITAALPDLRQDREVAIINIFQREAAIVCQTEVVGHHVLL